MSWLVFNEFLKLLISVYRILNYIFHVSEEEVALPDLPKQQILQLKEEEKYTSILADNSAASKFAQVSLLLIAILNIFYL